MSDSISHDTEHAHEPISVKTYSVIGGILVVGTILAFVFAEELELGWTATVFMIFGIASFKAALVALFFMHLKFERGWKYILVVPPVLLLIGLLIALLPDIAFRSYSIG
ncbi:MAG TPA: cytochrome C oxidase subunit IV family protein [Planctomycetota bacterium]